MESGLDQESTIKALIEQVNTEQEQPQSVKDFFENLLLTAESRKQGVERDWKSIINLTLAVLQKHPSVYLQFFQKLPQALLTRLCLSLQEHVDNQQLYDFMIGKLSSDIEVSCQLLTLNTLVDLSLRETLKASWERLLPLILRTAGLILNKYLKIKEEKASSSTDRVAADIIIQTYSEKWIEAFFLDTLGKYTTLLPNNLMLRRYFINFGCDLQEALLQSYLNSSLNKQTLSTLMFQVSRIFVREYSPAQLISVFNQTLRKNNMISPVKNVVIVDIYSQETLINPNGLNYIVKSILSQTHSSFILSEFTTLKSIIPILGESIKRQFPFKHDILDLALKVITQSSHVPVSDNQFDYPLSLLVANLVASKQNQSEFTNNKIDTILTKVLEWKWPLGRCLNFSNNVEVKKFVLNQMSKSNTFEYYILNSLSPLDSQKEFTEAYIETLKALQLRSKEYDWAPILLEEKRKYNVIDQRLKL